MDSGVTDRMTALSASSIIINPEPEIVAVYRLQNVFKRGGCGIPDGREWQPLDPIKR